MQKKLYWRACIRLKLVDCILAVVYVNDFRLRIDIQLHRFRLYITNTRILIYLCACTATAIWSLETVMLKFQSEQKNQTNNSVWHGGKKKTAPVLETFRLLNCITFIECFFFGTNNTSSRACWFPFAIHLKCFDPCLWHHVSNKLNWWINRKIHREIYWWSMLFGCKTTRFSRNTHTHPYKSCESLCVYFKLRNGKKKRNALILRRFQWFGGQFIEHQVNARKSWRTKERCRFIDTARSLHRK